MPNNGLNIAGIFSPPTGKNATITSLPWYYTTQIIPANFRSPFNPNPTLNALGDMSHPVTVIK